MLKIGIVGLPNVGKSTLFNALSSAKAEVSNYPFTTIDPNVGIVEVPDDRTAKISQIRGSKKVVGAAIEFVDIAGLVKGANKGEGLGNKFLSHIREVDAIAQVVRSFKDDNIVHVDGSVDPARDIGVINSELLLVDLATLEKLIEAAKTATKSGDKKAAKQLETFKKVKAEIEKGVFARAVKLGEEEAGLIGEARLLTAKPQLYILNSDESRIVSGDDPYLAAVAGIADADGSKVVVISTKLEADIKDLPPGEAEEYLREAKITEPCLPKLIKAGYGLLELITFYTSNEKETRAWAVKRGTKAPAAAGKIHSDMEKGFISSETVSYKDLIAAGSFQKAKESGLLRVEGKNYIISDGDVAHFRFVV